MRLIGIGIDIITLEKAKRFLKRHRKKILERMLTAGERKRLGKKKSLSPLHFSKMMVAKEAFFKAMGKSWMGLEGFGALEVKMASEDHFLIKTVSASSPSSKPRQAAGHFFKTDKYLGAQVSCFDF